MSSQLVLLQANKDRINELKTKKESR